MEHQIHTGIRFSRKELIDLAVAWIVITLIFSQGAFTALFGLELTKAAAIFLIPLFTVGIGFILHEMAHKFVAQHYGCWAEFRSDYSMLFLSFIISVFTGFVLLAPGAVLISGTITKRRNGIISVAGPLANVALALAFLGAYFILPTGLPQTVAVIGFTINVWLGLFNMIPFGILDGRKVWVWNRWAYSAVTGACVALLVLSYFLPL